MSAPAKQSRRVFLKSSLGGGLWTLGLLAGVEPGVLAAAGAPSVPPASPFASWLRFAADGSVTACTTVSNLGQGTHTAIAQIVAEELELPLAQIRIVHAPVEKAFHRRWPPGITTFASAGFASAQASVGTACAAAREMLIRAAAAAWQVEPAACQARQGMVLHPPSARQASYASLLASAAALTPPQQVALRPPAQWKVLGRSTPRDDIPSRVDGSAVYGIDVRRPDMLVAAVWHAPHFGAELLAVDAAPALALKGVRQVIKLPAAVAVVAQGYWQASKALALLAPRWSQGPRPQLDSQAIRADLRHAVEQGQGLAYPVTSASEPRQDAAATAVALAAASRTVDMTYELPYLAHAAMEPLNATAQVSADGAELWLSTQSQSDTQRAVAAALGLKTEQVRLHSQDCGGGFGRRLEHDFAVEAALIAKAAGATVKTIWSRQNDMRSGFYRPVTTARIRLALDRHGWPAAVRADMAGPSLLEHTGVTNGPPVQGFDWSFTMGWTDCSYALGPFDTRWTRVDHGVPVAYWRSVGNSQNCFFLEHTLEQAARLAGVAPLAYRRALLRARPRALAFLDALAARAGWDGPLAPRHYRGLAINGSEDRLFSGHVVEVEITAPGRFRLVRITAAIDPGVVANPRMVEAQLMGGTLFGLSAALFGEITFKNGQVEQANFDSYRLVGLAHTPPIDVLVLASGTRAEGVGEEGPPSIGPAIANALFAASGVPLARLPLSRAGWELA